MSSQIESTYEQTHTNEINKKFAKFVKTMLAQLEQDLSLLGYRSKPMKGAIADMRRRYEKMSFEERKNKLEELEADNKKN